MNTMAHNESTMQQQPVNIWTQVLTLLSTITFEFAFNHPNPDVLRSTSRPMLPKKLGTQHLCLLPLHGASAQGCHQLRLRRLRASRQLSQNGKRAG